MKKMFMALMAVATIAMVGCKKGQDDPNPKPTPSGDEPALTAVAGKYVIAIQLNGPICQGAKIAFPNGSKLMDGKSDWETDLAKIDYMEALTTDDEGKDFTGKNWYKITIDYAKDSLQGKPVMILDGAASLDWSYQTGDEKAWKVIKGEVKIEAGYAGESNETFLKAGEVYVLTCDYWKNNVDPCNVNVFPTVTWTVYMPDMSEYPDSVKNAVPYIHGNFDGWAEGHAMTKVEDGVYTFEYKDVNEGCEYQFTLGGNWDYKAIWTNGEGNLTDANMKVAGAAEEVAPDMFAKAAPAPETDEVWIKCAANDWTAAQMTETEVKGTFVYETTLVEGSFGNMGANIGVDEAMNGASWYALEDIAGANVGDKVVYQFVQTKGVEGTLTIIPANQK